LIAASGLGERPRGRLKAEPVLLLIVVCLISAAVGTTVTLDYLLVSKRTSPGPPSPGPGLSFESVVSLANTSLSNSPAGPWVLISALGIASPGPVWPFSVFNPQGGCQSIAGPTIWNGSGIPSTPQLGSGVVPFWSLLYLNSSGFVASADSSNTSIHYSAPISPQSPCGESILPAVRNASPVQYYSDSTRIASIAWDASGARFAEAHSGTVAYYQLGAGQLSNVWDAPFWSVAYWSCGLPGYSLTQGASVVGVPNLSRPPEVVNGSAGCSLNNFHVGQGETTNWTHSSDWRSESSTVFVNSSEGNLTISNATGLVAWMLNSSLVAQSSSAQEPISPVTCSGTGIGPGNCVPLDPGWYAVLTGRNGGWLDIYSGPSGRGMWLFPTVGLVSNDTILLYLSSSLPNVQYSLGFSSTGAEIVIQGTLSY
jgi:hypothetical protein